MQNVINIREIQSINKTKQDFTTNKAMLIAKMHLFMNDAENKRESLYKSYKDALMGNKTAEMERLALEITETSGKLSAFTICANLVAINI